VISPIKPHGWSSRYIDRQLGISSNPLSQYLRRLLLITTDHHFNPKSGVTKKYRLRESGVRYLRESVDGLTDLSYAEWCKINQILPDDNSTTTTLTNPLCSTSFGGDIRKSRDYDLVSRFCRDEYGTELDSLTFTYERKSNRQWHPLQNVRSEFRVPILAEAGLTHQYDIQCCAPTLIYQYALRLGQIPLTYIPNYIANRTIVRATIAAETGLDIKAIKTIINSLFSGARLGLGDDFAVSHLIHHDPVAFEVLKNNDYIQQLRSEIRLVWQTIRPHLESRTITDCLGRTRRLPISSRQKWQLYFELESQVMTSAERYLRESGNQCFLEHDGWSCRQHISIDDLCHQVYQDTGFSIDIDSTTTTLTNPLCITSFDQEIK
jgi:hypothetical protein